MEKTKNNYLTVTNTTGIGFDTIVKDIFGREVPYLTEVHIHATVGDMVQIEAKGLMTRFDIKGNAKISRKPIDITSFSSTLRNWVTRTFAFALEKQKRGIYKYHIVG